MSKFDLTAREGENEKVGRTAKVLTGWGLICLVVAFTEGIGSGVGAMLVGIGIYLLISALSDWFKEIDDVTR